MRVLLLTQHFVPEITAGRFRLEPFARALTAEGHDVRVICPMPNHPRGEIEPSFRGRPVHRRRLDGSAVAYVWVLVTPRKTLWTRLAYYASYAALATAAGALAPRPDVIVASSPPLTVGAVGALLAGRHRVPWVLDVRDIWPHSAVTLGELPPGRVSAAAGRLERALYRRAARVVTANDAFAGHIRSHGAAAVEVVPNGTTREWLEVGESEPDRGLLGVPDDAFAWAYAGNIGLAHGVEAAVEAAELLGDGFTLTIIGTGTKREEVAARAAALTRGRVQLLGLMGSRDAALRLRAVDAILVTERQEMTVSAKLYDACAVGRPIVAACRGELRALVEREGIALAVPHGDPPALATALRRLRDDPALAHRLSVRARAFAAANLREVGARRFAALVEGVAGEGGRAVRE